jgi:isoquinoline 1-oxidoreductase beta subunit
MSMSNQLFIRSSEEELPHPRRRTLLKASAASLVVGFRSPLAAAQGGGPSRQDFLAPNAFVTIGADDSVTLTMAKVEMGQGTYTSIPMLLAEELEVDLAKVRLRHAPPDPARYGQPIADQFTGGSASIRLLYEPMRQAGAAARTVLIEAAALQWQVTPDSCGAERGVVVHKASGRRLRYGQLVARASQLPVPEKVALKSPKDFKIIGQPAKRLDAKGKIDGSATFGIDVIVPGMKFASVVNSPVLGGRVVSVDAKAARAMRGVRGVIVLADAVAVVADNTWYARQGAAALEIAWDTGPNASLSTDALRTLMNDALKRAGKIARNDGDAQAVIAADLKRVEAVHVNPLLAHATMEPLNATVHVRADGAEIWTGTQVPARARDAAARLLKLPADKVVLHNFLLGGGFGRRLYHDQVDQAVLIGKQVRGPVKVTWSREEDIRHDLFRGLFVHAVSASLDAQGYPVALMHRFAGPSNLAVFAPAFIDKDGVDGDAVEGSRDLAYAIPNLRSEFIREDGPVGTGFWRGVGPTRNVLVLESFIDELAERTGKDPVQYRLAMLKRNERATAVVSRAAALSGWGSPMPARHGRGVALLYAWGTYMAQVVELSVDASGQVAVHKVTCVVDCGVVVNPDTVVAQMQSGIVFGLTAALYGEITLESGRVQQSNFHDYPLLRISEAPQIRVEIVSSDQPPGGVGEPGTAAVLPAFVNAVHAATGKRLYALPAKPEHLKVS